jgi:hypothetical protein
MNGASTSWAELPPHQKTAAATASRACSAARPSVQRVPSTGQIGKQPMPRLLHQAPQHFQQLALNAVGSGAACALLPAAAGGRDGRDVQLCGTPHNSTFAQPAVPHQSAAPMGLHSSPAPLCMAAARTAAAQRRSSSRYGCATTQRRQRQRRQRRQPQRRVAHHHTPGAAAAAHTAATAAARPRAHA